MRNSNDIPISTEISVIKQEPQSSSSNRSIHLNVWARIEGFLSSRAANTATTYKGVVTEWCRFLGADAGTEAATQKILSATDLQAMAYRKWLEKRPGQKPRFQKRASTTKAVSRNRRPSSSKVGLDSLQTHSTIWKKFCALRRIYRVLISADLGVKQNPFDTDRVPPPPKESGKKRPTEMVEFSFINEILSFPDLATPKGRRDKGILSVLFGAGLRRSEVASLRIGDVRKTTQGTTFLYLRATKSGKDAEQAIPDWAAEAVRAVIADRLEHGAEKGDFLFISFRGRYNTPVEEPISHPGIYALFKVYCLRAGAGDHVSPHSARATAITKLLEDGFSHRMVKDFSRHASVQMVELYDKKRTGVDENLAKKLSY